jgi:hypothetical protein
MAGALPPHVDPSPPYAWVVEYRPLDRCFTPTCRIGARAVHGYAKEVMEDGDPGAYVSQGLSLQHELFFERGVIVRPGESFELDLPRSEGDSELDVVVASAASGMAYDAEITFRALPGVGMPVPIGAPVRVSGKTVRFDKPKTDDLGRFARYGTHARLALPSRAERSLRITLTNRGDTGLSLGSPLVMKRVVGRGPRQGIMVIHDALLFHEAEAFLFGGTHDAKADWVRAAVAARGVYFPAGQSPGQGTGDFVVRFFTGAYYAGAFGWPGMFGKGFDETLPLVLPGPVARAAEQGFVTAFVGNNFTVLPNLGNIGWDVGFNSEAQQHPAAMARVVEDWARERPHDDAIIVWWNAATHAPHPTGRSGPPAPNPPGLPDSETDTKPLSGTWRNLLDGADHFHEAYDALRAAAPEASRVVWFGADHSSSVTKKMTKRPYRLPSAIATGLHHACGGTSEEANTPFAIVYDDPRHLAPAPRVVKERTNEFVVWRAFESFLGLDLGLPRSSTFDSPVFRSPLAPPTWDDRILVSVGTTQVLRASRGQYSYAFFDSRIAQAPAWSLSLAEQLMLVGGPTREGTVMSEELYDDTIDPYELHNVAGSQLEDTIRMRRELTDWQAAQWEDHRHPRHRNKLVFADTVDLEVFAPRSFTALVGDAPVPSSDPRLAHVHGREVVIVEGTEPVGIIELHGAPGPLVLKCSANGLPLDVLTPERPRFNLEVARVNCPLPAGPQDVAGPGEVLFSFEPASAPPVAQAAGAAALGNASGPAENDELLSGMKRWGYVRDIDDKKKP